MLEGVIRSITLLCNKKGRVSNNPPFFVWKLLITSRVTSLATSTNVIEGLEVVEVCLQLPIVRDGCWRALLQFH